MFYAIAQAKAFFVILPVEKFALLCCSGEMKDGRVCVLDNWGLSNGPRRAKAYMPGLMSILHIRISKFVFPEGF